MSPLCALERLPPVPLPASVRAEAAAADLSAEITAVAKNGSTHSSWCNRETPRIQKVACLLVARAIAILAVDPPGSLVAGCCQKASQRHVADFKGQRRRLEAGPAFSRLCPLCGGQMRTIAFITHSADIRQILEHIRAETKPPRITPARGPPLWDDGDAQAGEAVEPVPDWDEAAQTAPDFEVDQRVSW